MRCGLPWLKRKKAAVAAFSSHCAESASSGGLGAAVAELLAEFLNTASGVDDLVLAGEERMRFSGNLDLHERIVLALEIDRVTGLNRGTGDEFEIAGQVVENDFAIVWVNAFFHNCLI